MGDVIGLEVADSDHYQWKRERGQRENIDTLFASRSYESIRSRDIAASVLTALDVIEPGAVGFNGWAVPEARAALGWCSKRRKVAAVLMSETKEDDLKRYWLKEAVKRRLIRKVDSALVGGRAQRDYLVRLGMPAKRVFLGYDVVDNEHFGRGAYRARADADSLRLRQGLPRRYFFACTRFLPRKNVDGLLRAYARYRERLGDEAWGLVLAGDGSEERSLKQLAARLNLTRVVWPGFVQYPELPIYFGLAGSFIHPARQEAWGLVVNEAMACGLPVLVSQAVGARYELVEHGRNGFLFDPTDDSDIEQAMVRMSHLDEAARKSMGDRSREIIQDWSPERFGRQMLAAIAAARDGGTAP